jgi:hypothetical protein
VATQTTTTRSTSAGTMTGKSLIESDRVEGTTVYDPQGNNIGSIKRLMIEKVSGQVAYAVMSFGGFLGMGAEDHAIPWNKLTCSYAALRLSVGTRIGIGRIGAGSRSCMTTIGLPITGNRQSI